MIKKSVGNFNFFLSFSTLNTYPDLIKGFTCSLLKDDISETECHLENMKDKKFFNDNQVLKRLNSKFFLGAFKNTLLEFV